MTDYTCHDFAKVGMFPAGYLTGKTIEDHLNCQEVIEKKSWIETDAGDRVFWCYAAEDYYGGDAEQAVQDIERVTRVKAILAEIPELQWDRNLDGVCISIEVPGDRVHSPERYYLGELEDVTQMSPESTREKVRREVDEMIREAGSYYIGVSLPSWL